MALTGNCKSKGKYIAITFESDYLTESNTEKMQRSNTNKNNNQKKSSYFGCTNIIFDNCTSISMFIICEKC